MPNLRVRVRWHRLRLELVKVGVEQLGQGVIHFADQHVVVEIKVQIDPGLVQLRPEIHRLHSSGFWHAILTNTDNIM